MRPHPVLWAYSTGDFSKSNGTQLALGGSPGPPSFRFRCGHRTYCPGVLKVLVGGLTPRSVLVRGHIAGATLLGAERSGAFRPNIVNFLPR